MQNLIAEIILFVWLLSTPAFGGMIWPEPWPIAWQDSTLSVFALAEPQQNPLVSKPAQSACQTSNLTAFDMAKGRKVVNFTTNAKENFEEPKIRPLNSTAGEQWEFDGVSADGMQSFIFGFYRDPNYAILGTGNFRLSIEFSFADRTRFYEVYYPGRSIVETCPQGTRGIWVDEKDGYSFSFMVKADMSEAVITLNSDTVKGKAVIQSSASPLAADGQLWPVEDASTEPIPFWHWSQPIPAGTVDLEVDIKGRNVTWSGMGGHERFWSAFSWFTCLRNLQAVRAKLGPYVLSFFRLDSNFPQGGAHQSVVLFKEGRPVFQSTRDSPSDTDDFVLATKTYDGAVTGTLKDKVTGFQLELISPSKKRHFTFFVEHANLAFEYILGEGVGGSGFSGFSRGGHVGLDQYEGVALSEALTFPKNSPLFQSNYVE
ncbi:uncharacterized protein CTRU02_204368 [Colletotrichum truncatum]|uniref:Uncharacterized protein n=1 Tax=Colletotrichum truncatum TaxID=5467 RepID=A0ACC3ZBV2_COLTU|nr:uncharacterized protein CTRU02_13088 [Colletotrichum truncatum]KAF6783838.1 hypothetical protein CTRU02_13088 [Colletotrichum truncatum]